MSAFTLSTRIRCFLFLFRREGGAIIWGTLFLALVATMAAAQAPTAPVPVRGEISNLSRPNQLLDRPVAVSDDSLSEVPGRTDSSLGYPPSSVSSPATPLPPLTAGRLASDGQALDGQALERSASDGIMLEKARETSNGNDPGGVSKNVGETAQGAPLSNPGEKLTFPSFPPPNDDSAQSPLPAEAASLSESPVDGDSGPFAHLPAPIQNVGPNTPPTSDGPRTPGAFGGPDHRRPNGPPAPQPVQVVVVPTDSGAANHGEKTNETSPTAESSPEEVAFQSLLRTPRLTFDFLLNEAVKNNYERAIEAIDFSDRPSLTLSDKKDLAFKLFSVINRLSEPDLKTISNDEALTEYLYRPNPSYPGLLLVKKNGRFVFGTEALETFEALYSQLKENRPAVFTRLPFFRDLSDGWFRYKFGLRRIQWVYLGIVAVIGYFIGLVVSVVLYYVTMNAFHLLSSDLSEYKISKKTWRPVGWFLMYSLWYVGILSANVPPKVIEIMGKPVQFLAILMIVVTSLRLVDLIGVWRRKKIGTTKSKVDEILVPLIGRTTKIAIVVIGVIMVFQAFGFSAVGIISGMGIGGIAVALAAQNTIANFFGSLTVLMDRPFVIGDWIVSENVEGVVESVGLRSTRIRTFYDSIVTVPNNVLTTAIIDNMGRRLYRRYKTTLGVQYDTPPERIEAFCEGIRELILSYNFTRKDKFHVYANEFNASSIDILLICFFLVPDATAEYKARSVLILDIMRLAEKMDVRFAFPTQTIYNIPSEDRDYLPTGKPLPEFARDLAGELIEERNEQKKDLKGIYGESGLDETLRQEEKPPTLEELTETISKKTGELIRRKKSFFRRAS